MLQLVLILELAVTVSVLCFNTVSVLVFLCLQYFALHSLKVPTNFIALNFISMKYSSNESLLYEYKKFLGKNYS